MSEQVAVARASAVVLLCGGSHCPREAIAEELRRHDVAVIDVPEAEERLRNDADYLAARFLDVVGSLPAGTPVGLVGGNVAGAGVLIAAGERPDSVATVVSVNGRTDLAIDSISSLRVPTLLIVNDMPVLRMNREALSLLKGERRLEIIHGADEAMAGHIVEKATRWLTDRLQVGAAAV